MSFFLDGWVGKARLWKVTWLGYVGMALVAAVIMVMFEDLLGKNYWFFEGPATIVINIWGLVAMWNCAPNVKWRGWFFLARAAVVVTAIYWALESAGLIES